MLFFFYEMRFFFVGFQPRSVWFERTRTIDRVRWRRCGVTEKGRRRPRPAICFSARRVDFHQNYYFLFIFFLFPFRLKMCCSFLASPLDCVGDFWDDDCSLLIQAPAQKGNENSASSRFIPSNPQPNIDSVAGYGVRLLSFPLRRFVVIGQIYGAASFFALLLVEALVCFHPFSLRFRAPQLVVERWIIL